MLSTVVSMIIGNQVLNFGDNLRAHLLVLRCVLELNDLLLLAAVVIVVVTGGVVICVPTLDPLNPEATVVVRFVVSEEAPLRREKIERVK